MENFGPDQSVILLVEDREDDVMLIRRAFEKAKVINPIQVATNGEQAISYLKGEGKYANRAEYLLCAVGLLAATLDNNPNGGGSFVL